MKHYLLILLLFTIGHNAGFALTNEARAVKQVQTNKTYCSYYNNGSTNSFTAWMDKKLVMARCYTPDGGLTSRVVNGTGTVREFYDSGTNKMVCSYVDGLKNGKHIEWLRNGNVRFVREYSSGKRDGTWIYYYLDGSKQYETLYENNRELYKKAWDQNGTILLDRDFRKKDL